MKQKSDKSYKLGCTIVSIALKRDDLKLTNTESFSHVNLIVKYCDHIQLCVYMCAWMYVHVHEYVHMCNALYDNVGIKTYFNLKLSHHPHLKLELLFSFKRNLKSCRHGSEGIMFTPHAYEMWEFLRTQTKPGVVTFLCNPAVPTKSRKAG